MQFAKYHGLGNDYIVLDPATGVTELGTDVIRRVCDRHLGPGSDGILWGPFPHCPVRGTANEAAAEEPTTPHGTACAGECETSFSVRIFNPDGSEAEKSGNGIRIFSRYLWDTNRVSAAPFTVMTAGGPVRCEVREGGALVHAEMGRVSFDSTAIPVLGPRRDVLREEIEAGGRTFAFCAATIGNPHCVLLCDPVSEADARRFGPAVETDDRFPNRTNVQFMQVLDDRSIRIEIWERGAGYTLASGSSACAAAAAAHRLGLCGRKVCVHMPGGRLDIEMNGSLDMRMTGPVTAVLKGEIDEEAFAWQRG